MKRSHKFKTVGNAQAVIDASANLTDAAERLGVNRSTLMRWLRAGKVKRRGVARPPVAPITTTISEPVSAEGWRQYVLATYRLTETELVLVRLAVGTQLIAEDVNERPAVRMMAAGRFQSLVKQLALGDDKLLERVQPTALATTTPARHRERPSVDPRVAIFQVMK